MEKQTADLGPYVKTALGELQFLVISLTAERDSFAKQVQVLRTELDALKAKSDDNRIPKKRVSE